jgi:sn-glycerol 3-phosphate transport system substrate-binding protein
MTTAWQSWIHLENLSAYHNVPFATKENGFAGVDTELALNGPVQVKHIDTLGEWAKDGKFIYAGRRNEGGANVPRRRMRAVHRIVGWLCRDEAEAEFDFASARFPTGRG